MLNHYTFLSLDTVQWSEIIRNVALAVGAIIGVFSYRKSTKHNQYKVATRLKDSFFGDKSFEDIIMLLEKCDQKLEKVPKQDKYRYLGFIEEVYFAIDKGQISKDFALNMFGYYAISAYECDYFKQVGASEINFDSVYWKEFKEFVTLARKREEKLISSLQRS